MSENKAFSLLEISIVLIIISLLASIIFSKSYMIDLHKSKNTQKRIEIIENALTNFIILNNRLPCPANPKLPETSELAGKEACGCQSLKVDQTIYNNFCSNSSAYIGGSVPVLALNLPKNIMYDVWGNQIFYAVIEGVTGKNSSCSYNVPSIKFTMDNCIKGFISINDINSSSVTSDAVYVILSFGPSGKGAWNKYGNRNDLPILVEEIKNYNATRTGSDFILLPNSMNDRMILAYQTKNALQVRARIFSSGLACSYMKDIQERGASYICPNNMINRDCIDYLNMMSKKLGELCIK